MKNKPVSLERLSVCAIQTDIIWQDKQANLAAYAAKIAKVSVMQEPSGRSTKPHLIVLPEMFATGFSMDVSALAEPAEGGLVLAWLITQAKAAQAAICGSVMVASEQDPNKAFNRHYFVYPDGHYHVYDKRHLFRMGEENEHFIAGDKRVVVDYLGWRILLQTCYDLRFPAFCRNRDDYDLMINVASWPAPRRQVWRTLLQARALENQCYVLGVNRVGEDGNGLQYSGDSLMINARGDLAFDGASGDEQVYVIEIDLSALQKFKAAFPVILDADDFSIDGITSEYLS